MSVIHRFVAGAALAATAFAASAAGPTTEFALGGVLNNPTVHDLSSLKALPAFTQTVTFKAGGTPQTHTYTGASLWGAISAAGIQLKPGVSNDVLNKYVVVTGSDGYRSVYSLGEINPNFGNRQALIAYEEQIGGSTVPLGADGFARSTAPGDIKGGRYVSNIESVYVFDSASTQGPVGGGKSTQFEVRGDVLNEGVFDLAALQALPSVTQTVGDRTFTGVSFWSLLNSVAGLDLTPGVHNDLLGMYVVATGSDGYKSVFSLGELSPDFGNMPYMVAYEENGALLGDSGFARIVAPGDVRNGRWVSNLVSLEVFHAAVPVPEPETVLLMLAGLGVVLNARRTRTKTR